jgi:hypothetical protein
VGTNYLCYQNIKNASSVFGNRTGYLLTMVTYRPWLPVDQVYLNLTPANLPVLSEDFLFKIMSTVFDNYRNHKSSNQSCREMKGVTALSRPR